jgi:hypothetical protein
MEVGKLAVFLGLVYSLLGGGQNFCKHFANYIQILLVLIDWFITDFRPLQHHEPVVSFLSFTSCDLHFPEKIFPSKWNLSFMDIGPN